MMERILSPRLKLYKANWEPMRPAPIYPQVTEPPWLSAPNPHPTPACPGPSPGHLSTALAAARSRMTGHLWGRCFPMAPPVVLVEPVMQGK